MISPGALIGSVVHDNILLTTNSKQAPAVVTYVTEIIPLRLQSKKPTKHVALQPPHICERSNYLLEYPRYDKRPACPLSTVFRTCHAVQNALTVFVFGPLPHMYVSFLSLPYALRDPEPMYINPQKLLLDLARLRGSMFHPSERRSPAHFDIIPAQKSR